MLTVVADQIEHLAVLRTLGFALLNIHLDDTTDRVRAEFKDPEGMAAELIERHENGALELNSLAPCQNFGWAKSRIFACRRAHGRR